MRPWPSGPICDRLPNVVMVQPVQNVKKELSCFFVMLRKLSIMHSNHGSRKSPQMTNTTSLSRVDIATTKSRIKHSATLPNHIHTGKHWNIPNINEITERLLITASSSKVRSRLTRSIGIITQSPIIESSESTSCSTSHSQSEHTAYTYFSNSASRKHSMFHCNCSSISDFTPDQTSYDATTDTSTIK